MRLFEVAGTNQFIDDLTTELRNMRRGSDNEHATQTLSWEAFNNMVNTLGYGSMNAASLGLLVKSNPSLSNEIKTFDDKQIILKTKEEEEQVDTPTEVPNGPSVDTMAHQGAQNFQQKLS
jgi:hypothetical protein